MNAEQRRKAAEYIAESLIPLILKWDDSKAIEPAKYIRNLVESELLERDNDDLAVRCLDLLKRMNREHNSSVGFCLCDMAIDDPRMSDHSAICKEYRSLIEEARQR